MTDIQNVNEELQQEALTEDTNVAETVAETTAPIFEEEAAEVAGNEADTDENKKFTSLATKQEVIDRLKAIAEGEEPISRLEVEALKSNFYRIHKQETEEAYKAFIENGGNPEEYLPAANVDEPLFKEQMAVIKEKRTAQFQEQERQKEENYQKKLDIIEKVKAILANPDEVNKSYNDFKALQQEWNEIKNVPAEKATDLWKTYQVYVEQFYDTLKLNNEFRAYDFKKNLEMKTLLCEAVERLQNNENIVEASRALQQLHDEWAEIGPVARELLEDIWNRFKAASTIINKKHQAYFDELHAKEQDNLAKKQAIIEQIKSIAAPIMQAEGKVEATKWDKASEQIQALQSEWRTIGFAPKKYNQSIYDEYRATCDAFFNAKTAYFKELREQLNANLQTKRTLIERAQDAFAKLQAAQEANETIQWNELAEQFRTMQVEWKAVGVVSRKYSDELWKQFSAACDQFFNAMRENKKVERENYQKRKEAAKAQFAKKLEHMNDAQKLYRMRDNLQQEIKTAENNILFFTSKSKTANKLVDDMQRKIDELKKQLADIQEKINQAED